MKLHIVLLAMLCVAQMWSVTSADELQPADKPVEEVIDHYIDAKLQQQNVMPAAVVDDATFIRRVTLDLAGRIPLAAELQAFLQSGETDKRKQLVDRLLASPDFAYQQRNELNTLLMPTRDEGDWKKWLLKACQENRPWDQIFRQLMLSRDDNADDKPALAFLKARARDVDDLTNDTSKLFFGVSINCAKCHDHPLVLDWTQDHYFGMASFFNRTYLTKKNFLAERDEGALKFKTTEGVDKDAKLMFLTNAVIEEPAVQLSEDEKKARQTKEKEDNDRETPPAPPAFSRRAQIVEVALKPDPNGFFPRSIVNRHWARLLGHGLVHPVDQMHSANPASHPDLLTWLARDLETHGYDLKRLVRGIALSHAYARSSRWEQSERPAPELFAVATVRPLSPMQYSLSLTIAASNPEQLAQATAKPEDWTNRRRDLENHANGFSHQLETPGDNFQVSVSEALLFSNGTHVQNEYLRDGGDRLVGKLKATTDRDQLIQAAFQSVLSRSAETDEAEAIRQFLSAREDRQVPAIQQLLWTMLTGGEFRFNY